MMKTINNYPVKEAVKKLKPYRVLPISQEIVLNANENPFNTLEILRDALDFDLSSLNLNRYPDNNFVELKKAISDYCQVDENQIVCGNGSDEIIKLIIETFVAEEEVIVTHSPTFPMYQVFSEILGARAISVKDKDNFEIDIPNILKKAQDSNAKVIFLCSPNNPTGKVISEEDLSFILDEFSGVVVLDEAYVEFATKSYTQWINRYDNLMILRTFSKGLGLAGIRLGYGLANKNLIEIFEKVRAPYNVNTFSQAIGKMALENFNLIKSYIERLKSQRDYVYEKLAELDEFDPIESDANFLLVKCKDCERTYNRLLDHSVLVKSYLGKGPLLENYLRISTGTEEENQRLLEVLKEG